MADTKEPVNWQGRLASDITLWCTHWTGSHWDAGLRVKQELYSFQSDSKDFFPHLFHLHRLDYEDRQLFFLQIRTRWPLSMSDHHKRDHRLDLYRISVEICFDENIGLEGWFWAGSEWRKQIFISFLPSNWLSLFLFNLPNPASSSMFHLHISWENQFWYFSKRHNCDDGGEQQTDKVATSSTLKVCYKRRG